MSTEPRRMRSRLFAALSVVLATIVAALGLLGAPALAHAELESSDPAPGAVLDDPPGVVTLTFNESIEIGLGAIRLFDGSGRPVDVGGTEHPDGSDLTVLVRLPELGDGSYVVDWRVVSSDGHPIQGAYTFQVGPQSDLQAGILDDIIGRDHTSRPAGIALAISRGIVIAAIAIVFGGLVVIGAGIVTGTDRIRRLIGASAAVGAVVGLLQLPFEVGYATGRSLAVVFDADAWSTALDSRIGQGWVARALLLWVFGVLLVLTTDRWQATWWRVTTVVATIAVGIASAYGGHGAAGRWVPVGVSATAAHVAAMAIWLGGLALLLLTIRSIDAEAVRRFSRIAFAMVAVVVASGIVQSIRQLGSIDALTSTNYGTLLIWKVSIVAAVVAIAAIARRLVNGRLLGSDIEPTALDRPRIGRVLAIEAALAVAVIVTTSLLMAANPSADARSTPFSATLVDGDYLVSITVEPGRVGLNEMHVYLSSAASSLIQPDDVTAVISDPSRDVNPIEIQLVRSGAGHYTAVGATFPYAATWTMTVRARYDEFDRAEFTTTVPIR